MKNLLLVLPLIVSGIAHAQQGVDQGRGNPNPCPAGYILTPQGCVARAMGAEPSVFSGIVTAAHKLAYDLRELRQGAEPIRRDNRMGMNVQVTTGLYSLAVTMEQDSRNLENIVNAPVVANSQARRQAEMIDANLAQAIRMIPAALMTNPRGDLYSLAYSAAKSLGAVQQEINSPNVVIPTPGPINPGPSYGNMKLNKCVLRFQDAYGRDQIVTGEGFDSSMANADLYRNCGSVSGSFGSTTSAQRCQASLANARCVSLANYTPNTAGGYNSRFAACTLNFKDAYSRDQAQSGSGNSIEVALDAIWAGCSTVSGSFGSITSVATCKEAFVSRAASCILR